MATVSYGYIISQSDALPVPLKFTLQDSGIVAIDGSGAMAPQVIKLAAGIYIVATSDKTAAEYAAACLNYAQAYGLGRSSAGGGGNVMTWDQSTAPTGAELPTGTWS